MADPALRPGCTSLRRPECRSSRLLEGESRRMQYLRRSGRSGEQWGDLAQLSGQMEASVRSFLQVSRHHRVGSQVLKEIFGDPL